MHGQLSVAVLGALTGLYLTWVRGSVGDVTQHIGVSLDALIILFCAVQALRFALARQFAVHQRWALRLFLGASGVWFFRVGLFMWLIVNGGPVGFDPKSFTGPALNGLAFAAYLLPLAIAQVYWWAKDHRSSVAKHMTAMLLIGLTVLMCVGIFGTTSMWITRLQTPI